ncbi:hypothetical protein R1flu_020451 [Riccia fluitans]|uniref:Uncharacterized protein n=1 Tax=Riccia fluitans TaxID=41844 RepID=A0ABD1ZLS3_9MARC
MEPSYRDVPYLISAKYSKSVFYTGGAVSTSSIVSYREPRAGSDEKTRMCSNTSSRSLTKFPFAVQICLWNSQQAVSEVVMDAANPAMESFEEQGIADTQGVEFSVCSITETALRTPTRAPVSIFQGAATNLMMGCPLPEWCVPPIADRAVPIVPNFQLGTSLPSATPPSMSDITSILTQLKVSPELSSSCCYSSFSTCLLALLALSFCELQHLVP